MSISTRYTPAEIEDKWYDYWLQHKFFHSVPDQRKPYTVVIPPPNVTGILHIGHMLNNTIQDVLVRRKRMEGFNACWVPGTDHASIATEAKVVNMLREQGVSKSSIGRDEFLKHAWAWKEKYGGIILQQLRKLGASCDWDRTHFTMDKAYYDSVINVFIDLHKRGLIYRGKRMVNWDVKALTAVSDEEVIRKTRTDKLYYVKYPVEGTNEFITIATTRPETIMADTGVAVHPEDERYKHLVGKKAIIPFVNRPVPILADESIDKEYGTGCLKVTPAHDTVDYEIGLRHGLEVIDVLNEDGTMAEVAQVFVGMDRMKARKEAAKALEEMGLMVKVEDLTHEVGHSERTDAIIEPRLSMQWFVKMKEISKEAFEGVMNDEIQLLPPKFKNTYRHWMENIRDWCISRQLWWGHRIPAWYAPDGRFAVARTASEAADQLNAGLPALNGFELAYDRGNITYEEFKAEEDRWVRSEQLKQDEDVLDTWFSSWLWPIEVFRGMSQPGNREIEYYYPTNDLVTAPEILFFWVARMAMAGYTYMGKKPFSNVYLTGIVRDQLGRKMSKSLGNSPDPIELMKQYGADGVRVGVLLCSPAGNDLIFDTPLKIEEGKQPESKLCEQGRNFCNKLWNAFRLVHGWQPAGETMSETEKLALDWMEARIAAAQQELEGLFAQFRISEALMTIYKLIWDEFCSWFLEMCKPAEGAAISNQAHARVIAMFGEVLKLAHPFIPFITEEIWQQLAPRKAGESVMMQQLSAVNAALAGSERLAQMAVMQESIVAVRNIRNARGISFKEKIALQINSPQPGLFQSHLPILEKFLNLSSCSIGSTPVGKGTTGAVAHVGQHEFFVPIETGFDAAAEVEKINKEIEHTQGFLKSVMAKLGNERFVANAKPEVVDLERRKKEDAEAKLKLLAETLDSLKGK